MRNPKPTDNDVKHDREQIRKIYNAMKVELEQLTTRADAVLERLRTKAAKSNHLRLVKFR